ncbi:MAG TPA: 2'-5' RNA ligase family protein [Rhizomicrobium sp.]|nr:2'-5' RNA ligase family protein [Rhizomicrobium sp.]
MVARRPRRKFGASQKERIFLAALPDEATAARIHALGETLAARHGLTAAPILPRHLHVTLFHLGDWQAVPEEVVRLARAAAGEVRAMPFEVSFARARSFRNRTGVFPFVLTGDAKQWRALYGALAATLKSAGLGGATQGAFEPHVTLAYDAVRVAPHAVDPIRWTVRDFVLVHSRLGKTEHAHLGRWALA